MVLCICYLLSVLLVGLFFTVREQTARVKLRLTRLHRQVLVDAGTRDLKSLHKDNKSAKNDQVLELPVEAYCLGGRRIPWDALAVADEATTIATAG
ncbi:na proline symporter [Phytophthora cinnamomi]|uniref:na proline symporter n=1 Tax=Phytophthora cinnamomi TaxID=4785 RepID=UPI0035597D54|nr:na proline symporter [Phytophthora cinnamomi]